MKLASIVPMKNVSLTFSGQYAMLLAHLKDYYPKNYNENCYTIMDNSLIELGGAVDVETVYKAAKQCGADEFILPDAFQDKEGTILKVQDSIGWLYTNDHIHEMRLMAVCQGKDIVEFTECFRFLESIPEIHCIGIPKVASTLLPEGRPGLEHLWKGSPKAIHLLGCWSTLEELTRYKNPAAIRSCDTCIPALLSVNGIDQCWAKRPAKTIDLVNDEIQQWAYGRITDTLIDWRLL